MICIDDFSDMPDAMYSRKVLSVHTGMSGNAAYPQPPVSMDALLAAHQQFSDAMLVADSGGKVQVTQKNDLRISVQAMMKALLTYVNIAANGDKAKLQSSNFTLGKERSPIKLGVFGNVKATYGMNSGEVVVSFDKVDGAVSYQVDYALSPVQNNVWTSEPSAVLKHTLEGLTRGKEYAIRVIAVGRRNQRVISQVVIIMAV